MPTLERPEIDQALDQRERGRSERLPPTSEGDQARLIETLSWSVNDLFGDRPDLVQDIVSGRSNVADGMDGCPVIRWVQIGRAHV